MTIELNAKELFFLARLMNAKYIDYSYVAMMPDIQINYEINEAQSLESLENKGYIETDFNDDVNINPYVINTMSPVFFGTIDCLVKKPNRQFRIHQAEGVMVLAEVDNGIIRFRIINDEYLDSILDSDVEIECANVDSGIYKSVYSASDLTDEEIKNKAKHCMKGEWQYGV